MSPALNFWVIMLTNTALAALLAWAIPALIYKVATRVPYLHDYQVWLLLGAGLLSAYGVAWAVDTYSQYSGNAAPSPVRNAVGVFFLAALTWHGHRRYTLLHRLHPQATIDQMNRQRARLLARSRLLDERAPLARFELHNGLISFANPAAAALFGYADGNQLLGRPGNSLVHPEDRSRVLQHTSTHDLSRYECRVLTAYGKILTVEITPCYLADEPDTRILWTTDVTPHALERDRRIQAEREARLTRHYAAAADKIIARTAPAKS